MPQSNKTETPTRLRWVPLGKMRVSALAQRELNQSRVDHLAAEFDPDLVGNPVVSDRDRYFWIIDGQHRIEAMKQWLGDGWSTQQVQCRVYTDLDEAREADLFDRINDTLTVNSFDKFRTRVNAGRAVETDIDRQVRHEGLVISKDKIPGAIRAVGTLRRVYTRSDAATLGRTLRIIRDAYGDAGLEAPVIDGIGHLCQRFNGELDEEQAVLRLASAHGGVNGLLGLAETTRARTGQSKAQCVAAAAVAIINRGRGGKKLPTWWKSEVAA